MRPAPRAEALWNHAVAVLAALAVLAVLARLLWQLPEARGTRQETRIQLRWLPLRLPGVMPAPQAVAVAGPVAQAPATLPDAAHLPVTAVTPARGALPPVAAPAAGKLVLYGADGRVVLGAGTAGEQAQKSSVERVFEHRDELATGVGERATAGLFSKRAAGTSQSRAQRMIYGDDIQTAQARRPPDVAFNPALHERPADLGSAATGDAWKAAPVRHEAVPGLDGSASRRLRTAIAELERRYPRCAAADRSRWLVPARQQLEALQRVEYRYGHGADPVEAEHSLPAAADSAYDLARRALWEAERQMRTCG